MNDFTRNPRTAFISDIHLGTRECQAQQLLQFLAQIQPDTLVLTGDILDLWSLRKRMYWPRAHQEVLQAILAKSRSGTRVIFVPGNHDAEFRDFDGARFGNIEIRREYIHRTARGLKLLVTHGDELDALIRCNAQLEWLGNHAYEFALWANRAFNLTRGAFGFPYWSLATWLKQRAANAMRHVHRFEVAATQLARLRGVDGIVCGHIHRAALREHEGVLYCNDGDWVENCSSLIEDQSGELSLLFWPAHRAALQAIEKFRRSALGAAA